MNWYKLAFKIEVLSEEDKGDYIVKKELVTNLNDPQFEMDSAYSKSEPQCYIGLSKDAKEMFNDNDFDPKSLTGHGCKTCSVAFDKKEQKWYGWSHRARWGFGIGDPPGDETKYKGPAKTLEEAKFYAVEFAESVS